MFRLLSLLVCAALAVWAAFDLRWGGTAFLILAYGSGLFMYALLLATRPPACPELSWEANYLYRRHYIALVFPVAEDMSSGLNALRVLGLPWALWFAWKGVWWHAALAALLFPVLGPLCLWLAPYVYYGLAAKSGDRNAAESLEYLQAVRAWMDHRRDLERLGS
jgi:hypothetical protein